MMATFVKLMRLAVSGRPFLLNVPMCMLSCTSLGMNFSPPKSFAMVSLKSLRVALLRFLSSLLRNHARGLSLMFSEIPIVPPFPPRSNLASRSLSGLARATLFSPFLPPGNAIAVFAKRVNSLNWLSCERSMFMGLFLSDCRFCFEVLLTSPCLHLSSNEVTKKFYFSAASVK